MPPVAHLTRPQADLASGLAMGHVSFNFTANTPFMQTTVEPAEPCPPPRSRSPMRSDQPAFTDFAPLAMPIASQTVVAEEAVPTAAQRPLADGRIAEDVVLTGGQQVARDNMPMAGQPSDSDTHTSDGPTQDWAEWLAEVQAALVAASQGITDAANHGQPLHYLLASTYVSEAMITGLRFHTAHYES